MKKLLNVFLFLTTIMVLVTGCNSSTSNKEKAISLIRDNVNEGYVRSIGDFYNNIAGPNGKVTWKAFKPQNESNPSIYCVQINLTKTKDGETHTAIGQYLVNIKNQAVENNYFEVDGEPVNWRLFSDKVKELKD